MLIEVGAQHNAAGDPVLFDFLECPLCRTGIMDLPTITTLPLVRRQIDLRGMVDSLQDVLAKGEAPRAVLLKLALDAAYGMKALAEDRKSVV